MQLRQKISENLSQNAALTAWLIDFRAYEQEGDSLLCLLDDEEKRRAARYKLPDKALAYIIAHSFMRLLLGSLIQISPQELEFSQGNYGKPSLLQAPKLRFNLSYSRRFLFFASSTGGELGADIEAIRKLSSMAQMILQQFHPDEKAVLLALPGDEQLRQFYRLWTCKEAYIKALGTGLSLPLDSFAVTLGKPATIKGQREWSLHEFEFEEQHLAAIATTQAESPLLIRI
jgi:4'-phosphopantetheinyl transferase